MFRKLIISVMVTGLLVLGLASVYAEGPKPDQKDKCPVCGMAVASYTNWISAIEFKDGTKVFFDGPKDMFRFYFNMKKYGSDKTRADVSAVYVTEYYSTKMMNAAEEDLYFITGSNVYGPMGMELVPVKGKKQAETFMKDHNGKKTLRFSEVTMKDIPMKMKGMKMKMKGM
jgi:nitrous oxide reductase accessory protein NosL